MSSPKSKRRIQKRPGRAARGSLHRLGSATCQIRGCTRPAEVEISGHALAKPGWWRACSEHRRVFAAQRPLSPNGESSDGGK